MAQFSDENLIYNFSIRIRNLKEESKDDFEESGISDSDSEDIEVLTTEKNTFTALKAKK